MVDLNKFWHKETEPLSMNDMAEELQELRAENQILRDTLIYITEKLKTGIDG